MSNGTIPQNGKESKAVALPLQITEAQRDFLMQRTPAHEVKKRTARGGQKVDYIEVGYVIEQLNKVFGFDWDFEVASREYIAEGDEVIVEGRLTARANGHAITKQQFGGAGVKRFKRDNSPISLADDFKSAASDSLKKCASLLGVGLDVYRGQGGQKPKGNGNGAGSNGDWATRLMRDANKRLELRGHDAHYNHERHIKNTLKTLGYNSYNAANHADLVEKLVARVSKTGNSAQEDIEELFGPN